MKRIKTSSIFINGILGILGAYTVFPLYLALINSLKSKVEIYDSVLSLPSRFLISNYITAFEKMHFVNALINTVFVSFSAVTVIVIISSLAGYKLSRTPGKISNTIFFMFVASMLIPFHSIMIPLIKEANLLSLLGKKEGLAIIYVGLAVSLPIFLYHGFVKSIPRQIEESAYVDGCGELKIFVKIVFPMLKPITSTIIILNNLWFWNDFLLPLLVLNNERNYTLVISCTAFYNMYNIQWHYMLAALIMTFIPVLILFFLFQKYIISGIIAGALKG